jgi:peptide/nickel transport system substrate-binding protein
MQMTAAGASAAALTSLLAACGGDDDDDVTDEPAGGNTPTAATVGATTTTGGGAETPEAEPTAAATTPGSTDAGAAPSGEATVAQGPEITDLDASMATGMLTFNLAIHNMEPLLFRGEDLLPEPFLAETYEYVDPTTLHLTIREGVVFHTGDPLTVDDVVFTLQRVSGPDTESDHRPYTGSVAEVSAVDERTVEITFTEHDATFLGRLTLIPIVPKAVVEERGAEDFNANPVGTGPYQFVNWERGQRVTYEAFPDYWREQPRIQTLHFRGIPEDSTRMAELQTGTLAIATNVPTQLIPELEESDDIRIETVNSLRAFFVVLNTHQPPFDDVRVRQAVNYAIDRQLLIDGILDGHARPISQPFGPEVFGANPELDTYYTYDPDKARSLLAEAGFEEGTEVNFFGPSGRYLKDVEVIQNVAAQLEEVGFRVNQNVMEFQAYFDTYVAQLNNDLHMGMFSNANNTADADYNLALNLHSEGRAIYWSDPEVDAAIDEARTILDTAEREQKYHELLQTIVDAAPWLFLYTLEDVYGVSSTLQNWTPRPDEMIYLYGASLSDG